MRICAVLDRNAGLASLLVTPDLVLWGCSLRVNGAEPASGFDGTTLDPAIKSPFPQAVDPDKPRIAGVDDWLWRC
jgi:hypothetical protein